MTDRRLRRPARATSRWAALLAALALSTGCGYDANSVEDRGAPASYEPVPDEELFAAVRALEDVRSAKLTYLDQLGQSNDYRAEVVLDAGLPQRRVTRAFDQVVTILRHGRWQASHTVLVYSPGETDAESGTAHDLFSAEDYNRYFGPQSGQEGWPPPFVNGSQ